MNSTLKTIEAGRAAKAFEFAEAAGKDLGDESKAYKSYLKKLPAYIQTNGLGATLAFVFAKSGDSGKGSVWKKINEQFEEWLKDRPEPFHTAKADGKTWSLKGEKPNPLSQLVIHMETRQYRAVTVELLALIGWMRRYADGLIEGEDDE